MYIFLIYRQRETEKAIGRTEQHDNLYNEGGETERDTER